MTGRQRLAHSAIALGVVAIFWAVWAVYPHWWICIPISLVGTLVLVAWDRRMPGTSSKPDVESLTRSGPNG